MPLDLMELNVWFSIVGLIFASTNMFIGSYFFSLGKEKPTRLIFRLHSFFGTIGMTFFAIISILCLLTLIDSFTQGIPPPFGFSFIIHSCFATAGFFLFAIKITFSYFDKTTIRNDAKIFGIIVFFAWLLPWISVVFDYYFHVIPDLGMVPNFLFYPSNQPILGLLFTFFLPYFIGFILFIAILVIRKRLSEQD